MANVSPDDFRGALGSWAAGVSVVTTNQNGQLYGITVSSFSSLSMDPLLVLVCIANSNKLANMVKETKKFAVSILAEGQDEISGWFSKSGREPVRSFDAFDTFTAETGCPIISGSIAHLDCELYEAFPGGDHIIAVGHVLAAGFDPNVNPLMYFRRGYRTVKMD